MLGRRSLFTAMLTGSFVVPYVSSSDFASNAEEWLNRLRSQATSPPAEVHASSGAAETSHAVSAPAHAAPATLTPTSLPVEPNGANFGHATFSPAPLPSHGETAPATPAAPRPEGSPVRDLAEVVRFDVTPGWVIGRWPRVSASLAELDAQGLRVPLVTGAAQDDLAGSLTYYFDKEQHVERITFHGTTGDPRRAVALVTGRFELKRQVTDDPSVLLYQTRWNGKTRSELRVKPAKILRADQPYARFEVDLALRR